MSVKLMSLVFDAAIPDLEYTKKEKRRKVKASTATIVLLAYADHANEYGEGTYPGYVRLIRKTKLSAQGLADTIEGLKQNELLSFEGRSKLNTNAYSINVEKLNEFLKPLEKRKSSDLRNGVKPVELNHPSAPEPPSNDNDEAAERLKALTELYTGNIGDISSVIIADTLKDAAETYTVSSWYKPAFEIAVRNNARKWEYVNAVLDGWKRNGFGWKPEYYKKNGKNGKNGHHPPPPKTETPEQKAERIRIAQELVA